MTVRVKGDGTVIEYANTGAAISSGDVVVMGAAGNVTVGVALADIAATTGVGSVLIEGVVELVKLTAAVIVAGETVDWDSSAASGAGSVDDNAMTPAAGDVSDFGIAVEDAGSGILTVKVKLLPGNGTIT